MDSARPPSPWLLRGFVAFVAVLLALHLWPPHGGPEPVVLGVFPWDLAWHLGWMAAAGAAVFVMTSTRLWPDGPGSDDDDGPGPAR